MATSPSELLQLHGAVEEVAQKYNLCRKRLWDLGLRVPGRETRLRLGLRTFFETYKHHLSHAMSHEDHGLCTYDFCEFSLRNFTAVEQLHILDRRELTVGDPDETLAKHTSDSVLCVPINDLFPQRLLNQAVRKGELTAWDFDGKKLLQHPHPFMAVSHVWSDGTGSGQWGWGSVNECLYQYFKSLAQQFQCRGIWWDAICVPPDKSIRGQALARMDLNYQLSRITLVHDNFLRRLPFKDAETASFAIVSSSWFTRAWTALELARSQKVKIVFRNAVKDLDEDILSVAESVPAAEMIRLLRPKAGITTVQRLLDTLGPRYLSWPGDRVVIAALLTGVPPLHSSGGQTLQSTTYEAILEKLGYVAYGHLLHSSHTMVHGFTWCPADPFVMPHDSSEPLLKVSKDGEVRGVWTVLAAVSESDCLWGISDRFVEAKTSVALNESPDTHVVLTVPSSKRMQAIHHQRGLVVEVFRSRHNENRFRCRYVGSIRLGNMAEIDGRSSNDVSLCIGDVQDKESWTSVGIEKSAWEAITSCSKAAKPTKPLNTPASCQENNNVQGVSETEWTAYHYASWIGGNLPISSNAESQMVRARDRFGREPIHLAAERANSRLVAELLERGADPNARTHSGRTSLHFAAYGGSLDTWQRLLEWDADFGATDHEDNLALHVAAEYGQTRLICRHTELTEKYMSAKGKYGLTPLHLAILGGHTAVANCLIRNGADATAGTEPGRFSPLHFAAIMGNCDIVDSLLNEKGPTKTSTISKKSSSGWTPLHLAAIQGDKDMLKHLEGKGADTMAEDTYGWTAQHCLQLVNHDGRRQMSRSPRSWSKLHLAAFDGLRSKVKELLSCFQDPDAFTEIDSSQALVEAASFGYHRTVQLLIYNGWSPNDRDENGRTPMYHAAHCNYEKLARLLVNAGANLESKEKELGRRPLHVAAERGHDGIVSLLAEHGADVNRKCQVPEEKSNNEDLYGVDLEGTPLALAIDEGHRAVVVALLEIPRLYLGKHGENPILFATRLGYEDVASGWLSRGSHLFFRDDPDLKESLRIAVRDSQYGLVEQLLHHGVKANRIKLLKKACSKNNEQLVELLLRMGITNEAADMSDYTPIWCAALAGNESIFNRLLKYGASATWFCHPRETWEDSMRVDGSVGSCVLSPLVAAVRSSNAAIVSKLLEISEACSSEDEWWTPLHQAAWDGNFEIAELILKRMPQIKDVPCPAMPSDSPFDDNYSDEILSLDSSADDCSWEHGSLEASEWDHGLDQFSDESSSEDYYSSSDEVSPDDGSSNKVSPDDGSPDDGSPDDGSPDDGSSDEVSPDDGSPDDGSPDDGSPDDGSSDEVSPDDGSPDDGSPDDGSSDEVSPDDGSPDDGSLDNGSPNNGSPDDGSPDDGSPDDGSPDDGSPDDGSTDGDYSDDDYSDDDYSDDDYSDGDYSDGDYSDDGSPDDGSSVDGLWFWKKNEAAVGQKFRFTALHIAAGLERPYDKSWPDNWFPPHRGRQSRGSRSELLGRRTRIVQLLLEAGADYQVPCFTSFDDAMYYAAKTRRIDAVKLLIEFGAPRLLDQAKQWRDDDIKHQILKREIRDATRCKEGSERVKPNAYDNYFSGQCRKITRVELEQFPVSSSANLTTGYEDLIKVFESWQPTQKEYPENTGIDT